MTLLCRFGVLALLFSCSQAQARELRSYEFEAQARAFADPWLPSQPATLKGSFDIQDIEVSRISLEMQLQSERELRAYLWKPTFSTRALYGWLQPNSDHTAIEVVIEAPVSIDPTEVQETVLMNLERSLNAILSFLCPSLPSEIGQEVDCKMGLTSGFEEKNHSNPTLRSLELNFLSMDPHVMTHFPQERFIPLKIRRVR